MIISHSHKFIFLKTRKTAGTSLEISLSKFCDSDDIITGIGGKDELVRSQLGFQGPCNFEGFKNHDPAEYIKKKIDPEIWENYFKFTIIRNPVDQIISRYYWFHRKGYNKLPDINDWILKNPQMLQQNFKIYSIGGKSILDDFIFYSTMKNDCDRISNAIGLPENLGELMEQIKTKNSITKKNHPPLNSKTIKFINKHTQNELSIIDERKNDHISLT